MEALACLVCDFQSFLGFNNESAERRKEKRRRSRREERKPEENRWAGDGSGTLSGERKGCVGGRGRGHTLLPGKQLRVKWAISTRAAEL